ncbi:hypothetical protein CRG98_031624 [Punica granatum]|nr:hypothetical protein CRG98_031624 [Punica granatum]
MDMSAGDFLTLFYLLKVPTEEINLKAILVTPTGWASAATIDVIYDLLHMMGRDDIPVGLGDMFAMNQSDPIMPTVGDCKYAKAIPHGSGGVLDSDTLYGLARDLPRSPRRYTAENSVKYGAPRDTDHPELRQPLALEIWESTVNTLEMGSKITILTNGPLTNLAKIIQSSKNATSVIQDVYIVGGHIHRTAMDEGNVFTIPSNKYAEFNMFLDPLAAKTVLSSELNVTLIPLSIQRRVSSFTEILKGLNGVRKTPEFRFAYRLLLRLNRLMQIHKRYLHMDIFLGEILGAMVLAAGNKSSLKPTFSFKPIRVIAEGVESEDGYTYIDNKNGKLVTMLEYLDPKSSYLAFWGQLSYEKQSAVIGSFKDQKRMWSLPPNQTETSS